MTFSEVARRFRKPWVMNLIPISVIMAIGLAIPAWRVEATPAGQARARVGRAESSRPVTMERVGEGGQAAWIFTPNDPRPTTAPVILFIHGYRATDPYEYGAWIDHLVKRGNIVIYPIYEEEYGDSDPKIFRNLVEGSKTAINHLMTRGPVTPDLQRYAIVGHSFGGGLSTVLAARAHEVGLPVPKAIMSVEPGWRDNGKFPTEYLDRIPPSVLLVVVEADQDQFADSRQGSTILSKTSQIPQSQKGYIRLQSNRESKLVADHYAPLAPDEAYRLEHKTRREERRERIVSKIMKIRDGEIDALDRNGFWKLFDALAEGAFRNQMNVDQIIRSGGTENMQVVA